MFQFLYRIGLLFPLQHILFGMIFVTERGWNAPILKVIRCVSESYQSAPRKLMETHLERQLGMIWSLNENRKPTIITEIVF